MISFCCPQCNASYRFPDTRGGAKITCSKCKQLLEIPLAPPPTSRLPSLPLPASRPVPTVATVAPTTTATTGTRPAPPPLPRPAPPPIPTPLEPITVPTGPREPLDLPPEPPASRTGKKWYYESAGDAVGPVTESGLGAAAENGALAPDARLWSEGMAGWTPALEVLPRVFDGRATKRAFGTQWTVAAILAVVAILSLAALGGAYFFKGRKPSESTARAITSAERERAGAAAPPGVSRAIR